MCISTEFICKCGKMKGWITEGKETLPCPECGRIYFGYYDKKNLTISGKEIKPKRKFCSFFFRLFHFITKKE